MSKRRREWKESLKQDVKEQTTPTKKEKIKILKDETYKNVKGEMILVSNQTHEIVKNNTLQDFNSLHLKVFFFGTQSIIDYK